MTFGSDLPKGFVRAARDERGALLVVRGEQLGDLFGVRTFTAPYSTVCRSRSPETRNWTSGSAAASMSR